MIPCPRLWEVGEIKGVHTQYCVARLSSARENRRSKNAQWGGSTWPFWGLNTGGIDEGGQTFSISECWELVDVLACVG
jgi:hypothetical protein